MRVIHNIMFSLCRFGSGYTIMLKLGMSATGNTNDLAVNTERIESFIEQKFPGACLQESRHVSSHVHIE